MKVSLRVAALTAAVVTVFSPAAPVATTPAPDARWEWQLSSVPTAAQMDADADVSAYDVDGFDASTAKVGEIHARGWTAVCYISAGSWENWRPDASLFPASVKGNSNGWAGERWLDIRRLDVLGPIMTARMQMCADKGFDAVEPDNVDGYTNSTGFPLIYADQLAYNRWLADTAHSLGLLVALKNDVEQVADLEPWFDWALNEECFRYRECGAYSAFTSAGKVVWNVEYRGTLDTLCPKAAAEGLTTMRKRYDLDAWRRSC